MSTVVYFCDVFETRILLAQSSNVLSKASFFIDFFFAIDSFMTYRNLMLPQDHLLHNRSIWSAISSKLSEMDVPVYVHSDMIFKIIGYARSIVNQEHNLNCNIIPLVVSITAETGEDAAISEAARQSINEQVVSVVPASRSSIKALKRIKVEGFSKPCVICLDEILVGSEATLMPCSHRYHQHCIVNWLEISNLCPLCRFQMPRKWLR